MTPRKTIQGCAECQSGDTRDASTGAQIGNTFTLAGSGQPVFTSDSSRVIVYTGDYGTEERFTRFAALDATTGAQVGTSITLAGNNRGLIVTPDGTRAVISSATDDPDVTSLVVVDLVTGTQLGDTVTVPGYAYVYNGGVNSDGTRIVVDFYNYDDADKTHRVLVVNTVTGTTQTFALRGQNHGVARFTSDGTQLILDTYDDTYDYSNPGVVKNRTTIVAIT